MVIVLWKAWGFYLAAFFKQMFLFFIVHLWLWIKRVHIGTIFKIGSPPEKAPPCPHPETPPPPHLCPTTGRAKAQSMKFPTLETHEKSTFTHTHIHTRLREAPPTGDVTSSPSKTGRRWRNGDGRTCVNRRSAIFGEGGFSPFRWISTPAIHVALLSRPRFVTLNLLAGVNLVPKCMVDWFSFLFFVQFALDGARKKQPLRFQPISRF